MFDLTKAAAWCQREQPLAPTAAYAEGEVWLALLAKLGELTDEQLNAYQGIGAASVGIVIGENIPWVDGLRYCGSDAGIYMPTDVRPVAPMALAAAALKREVGDVLLILPSIGAAFDVSHAAPLSQHGLTKFAKKHKARLKVKQ